MTPQTALQKAIEAVPGGAPAIARSLKIAKQAVYSWKQCPPTRVLAVEALTGGKISRSQLRPDIYPVEKTPRKAA